MARCKVEQVRCDRCKRVQTVPVRDNVNPQAALSVVLDGEVLVKYDDLCTDCKDVVKRTIEDLKEWNREVKQQFGPTIAENAAAPLSPAPVFSPPKPHSQASTKR